MPFLVKTFAGIGLKLLTEAFMSKVTVYLLQYFSQKTNNKVDDKMTAAVAEALGVKLD
jgi:hypothetical protein